MKKVFLFSLSAAIVLFLTFLYIGKMFTDNLCANQILSEKTSPDLKYKAIVFMRNCGATTGYSLQISILEKESEIKNQTGNILILDDSYIDLNQQKTTLNYHWQDNNNLKFYLDAKTKVYLQEAKYGSIFIHIYNLQK